MRPAKDQVISSKEEEMWLSCHPGPHNFQVDKFVQPVRTALLNDAERRKLRITSSLLSGHGSVVPNPRGND